MTFVPALAATLEGHNGKGGSGISPEDTFLPVYENDCDEPGGVFDLQPGGDGEGFLAAGDGGLLNTVDADHVAHAADSPKPASDVKSSVRRLLPVECERLQGLPDGWTTPGPDSRRYAALGDAVTVTVGEWIGRRILAA